MKRLALACSIWGCVVTATVFPQELWAAEAEAQACEFPEPAGPSLLEIIWPVQQDAPEQRRVALDRGALTALPQESFRTSTIWTFGEQLFKGVRLAKLIDCLGVDGGLLVLSAKNEYLIEIPVESLRPDGALIALERNGRPMSTRDKGPLWLVYPYDADPAFQTESIYAQSIWQLDRIEIEP